MRLTRNQVELVWRMNKVGGNYIAKLGYSSLQRPPFEYGKWWWGKLWKNNAPLKSKLFMWLVLNNNVLPCEMLIKRNKVGPRICMLYRKSEENTLHLFLNYFFSHQFWTEVEEWYSRRDLKQFRVVPILVVRVMWLARNAQLFEDKVVPPF